jgi:CDP-diacylglycerol---serine O-phosphatidyltransferase
MAPMTTVPGVRFVPNAITVLSFSTGLTSIVFATQGRWMLAMWMIAASTVLDSLDGPAARLLQSSSRVGAELDSLSDLSAFGICPAVLIFFWQSTVNNVSEDELWLVWGSCLVYAACTALRLARFNSLLDDEPPKPFAKQFFTGVPSPPGALLAIVPIIVYEQFGSVWFTSEWIVAVWTILVGLLMVSSVPTIALKSVRIPPRLVLPLLVILVFGVVAFLFQQRIVALIGITIYVLHIPYAIYRYRYLSRHPELWETEPRPRRTGRRQLRLRARPRGTQVAGRPARSAFRNGSGRVRRRNRRRDWDEPRDY